MQVLEYISKKEKLTMARIAEVVSRYYNINIFMRCRKDENVKARFMAIYLMRLKKYSSLEIAKLFDLDRSSVLYAAKEVEYRINNEGQYPGYKTDYEHLLTVLRVI